MSNWKWNPGFLPEEIKKGTKGWVVFADETPEFAMDDRPESCELYDLIWSMGLGHGTISLYKVES